jgi:hypothetical protein
MNLADRQSRASAKSYSSLCERPTNFVQRLQDRLPSRLACASALEAQELSAVVEHLERRKEPSEPLRSAEDGYLLSAVLLLHVHEELIAPNVVDPMPEIVRGVLQRHAE